MKITTNSKDYYSAPELAKLLKVNASTIKRWVDKNLLKAEKTAGGHRRVNADSIAAFISKQKNLAGRSYILNRLSKKRSAQKKLDWQGYYFFLYSNTSLSSKNILEEQLLMGVGLLEIIEEIILPVLVKIGQAWRNGHLNIYEEHRMTFLLRSDLLRLDRMLPIIKANSPMAILACVKDEHHEIPLLLLHLLLKQQGWRPIILGINTPAEQAALAVKKNQAKILCLTKSFSKTNELNYLETLHSHLGKAKPFIALGGVGWKAVNIENKYGKKFSEFREFLNEIKNSFG